MRGLSAALRRLLRVPLWPPLWALLLAWPCGAEPVGASSPEGPGELRPEPSRQIRLAAVGDVVFGRYLRPGDPESYSPVSRAPEPLSEIAPLLRGADVAFANLETPLLARPARLQGAGAFVFRGDPSRARSLRLAGLRVLSLANNHSTNLGLRGAAETRGHLLAEGLRPVGAGATRQEAELPALLDTGGLRLAVLAFTLWNGDHAPGDGGGALSHVRAAELLGRAAPLLQAARRRGGADWVAVSLHWGIEGTDRPTEEQRRLGRALIDAGADLVLGHHPHVLQEVERYRGGLIAYSLGNFLFDNPQLASRQSAVLRVTLRGAGPLRQLVEPELVPVLIGAGDFVPRLATGAEHRALAARLAELAPGLRVVPEGAAVAGGPAAPAPAARAATLARAAGWVEPEW